jgi:hypothetical protein
MTVPSANNRNDYLGDNTTPTYQFGFRIFSKTQLIVVKVLTGTTTLVFLTVDVDYTVDGVGEKNGGTITLTAGNLPTGDKLTILRGISLLQETDIRNLGDFHAEVHEDEFDRRVMTAQQQQEILDRCLKLAEIEAGSAASTKLPLLAQRLSKVFAWDASGNPTAISAVPEGSVAFSAFGESLVAAIDAAAALGLLGVSAFIQTLLNDVDAAAARATLEVSSAEVSPGAIGASQNNYAGLNTGLFETIGRLTSSGDFNITGFTGGATRKRLAIRNIGANTLTLTHEDAASTAANRMTLVGSASCSLAPGDSVELTYDGTTSRWVQTSQVQNQKLDGIVEGEILQQAAPNTTLRTVGLVVMKSGQRTKIANQNLNISANASGNPRVDLVQWNGTALSVKAGVTGADPDCPAPDAGNVPIAVVWVPTGFTQVLNIGSSAANGKLIALYFVTGLFAWRVGTDTTTSTAGVDIADTKLPLYIPKAHAGFRAELNCLLRHAAVDGAAESASALINLNGNPLPGAQIYVISAATANDQAPAHVSTRLGTITVGANKWQPRLGTGTGKNVSAISPQVFLSEWA